MKLFGPALGLATLLACGTKDTQPLAPAQVATVIGREGGMAVSPSGVLRLEVPAGALEADTTVRISEDTASSLPDQVGPTYRVSLAGAAVKQPLTLIIAVPSARSKDVVTLVDVSGGQPTPVPGARFDMGEGAVRVKLTAPTSYAVIVRGTRSCDAADSSFTVGGAAIQPCWITEEEPNDSLAAAQSTDLALDSGVDIGASIDASDDYYSFVVPSGATGAIFGVVHSIIGNYGSCPPGLIVQGELLDEQGRVLSDGDNEYPCVAFNYHTDPAVRDLAPGRYTIRLTRGAGGQDQGYRFVLFLAGPGNGTVVIGPDTGY